MRNWTKEQERLFYSLYATMPTRKLAALIAKTYEQVKTAAARKHLLKSGDLAYHTPTPVELKTIKELFPTTPTKLIARQLGLKIGTVNKHAYEMGLKHAPGYFHSPIYLEQISAFVEGGKKNRFAKGHASANKGLRRPGWAPGRMAETQFKKGQLPHNTKHDGAIIIRDPEGTKGGPYKWIRLSLGKWKAYHVFIWERKHGPVPKGSIVLFRNGNTLDCRLGNLRCISRRQHALESREKDGFIAMTLSRRHGSRGIDRGKYDELLKHPDLLEAKRRQLQLKRELNEKENGNVR